MPLFAPKCVSLGVAGLAIPVGKICDRLLGVRHTLKTLVPELLLLFVDRAIKFDVTLA